MYTVVDFILFFAEQKKGSGILEVDKQQHIYLSNSTYVQSVKSYLATFPSLSYCFKKTLLSP